MTTIGVTGHMNLTPATADLIRGAITDALGAHAAEGDLVGVSCIAAGADSIFAEVVLDLGGQLTVILPSADYRQHKVKPGHAPTFDALLEQAATVQVMPHDTANRDAYEAANNTLLATSDQLVAVWDGQGPADKGGTAAVVAAARTRGIPVHVIWPDGSARS